MPIPRVNVSVKLSALFSQFDPIDPEGTAKAVSSRLRPILRMAKETGAFVNFDMEQHSFKDVTLYIFKMLLTELEFRDWHNVGIAIQAYLKDTERDLADLLTWAKKERKCPISIRLVKGAYWDYETVIAAQNDWPEPSSRRNGNRTRTSKNSRVSCWRIAIGSSPRSAATTSAASAMRSPSRRN